jgi:hypothetical protein
MIGVLGNGYRTPTATEEVEASSDLCNASPISLSAFDMSELLPQSLESQSGVFYCFLYDIATPEVRNHYRLIITSGEVGGLGLAAFVCDIAVNITRYINHWSKYPAPKDGSSASAIANVLVSAYGVDSDTCASTYKDLAKMDSTKNYENICEPK